MTKAQMIETIKKAESSLWLALAEYENLFAPDDGDRTLERTWNETDNGHLKNLHAWYAVSELMKELGITCDFDDENHRKASELTSDLFRRRQASKGIFYDKHGNEVNCKEDGKQ